MSLVLFAIFHFSVNWLYTPQFKLDVDKVYHIFPFRYALNLIWIESMLYMSAHMKSVYSKLDFVYCSLSSLNML
jgi:hypothetical protein